ncbi:ParB N-terminal domain-containing protein [uncultured Bacteroides sp.]|uniref:ParB N-terminal domain-containing protein n=1 Tax=uncultured Bacteroides sp. TaxID=162156 RepID=UPI002AAB918B|nr:ParB N-terminal domain-containing protein [uncultured Bacteroides sp.]
MSVVYRKISDLKKYDNNPRTITNEQLEKLKESILKNPDYFEARPIVLSNRTGEMIVIAGNQRLEASIQLGLKKVPTYLLEKLTEEREHEIMIRDNVNNGEWDMQKLLEWDNNELLEWGCEALFSSFDEHLFNADGDNAASKNDVKVGNLRDRFIIPPFSILDTKLGSWQERKRAWLSLGIKSEEGRDKEITYGMSSQPPRVYEVRNKLREMTGVDPSWKELRDYCNRNNIPLMEGTSIFDPVLCELSYRWFNIPAGEILDPFAGGSVRGIVATMLGYKYTGIDLREEQVLANYNNSEELSSRYPEGQISPTWLCGDSASIDEMFQGNADMIFSCPPYADLEVYSDDPKDLSNMDYESFLAAYRTIISLSCEKLRENRFAVFVVGEVRDKKGANRGFVSDTIKAFVDSGLHYYNEMILANVVGSLALRVTKQFNNSRKIGKLHQNVLVFYKGDVKNIKKNFPELDFSDCDFLDSELENEINK